ADCRGHGRTSILSDLDTPAGGHLREGRDTDPLAIQPGVHLLEQVPGRHLAPARSTLDRRRGAAGAQSARPEGRLRAAAAARHGRLTPLTAPRRARGTRPETLWYHNRSPIRAGTRLLPARRRRQP